MVCSPAWVDTLHTNNYQRLAVPTTPNAELEITFLIKNAFSITKCGNLVLTLSPLPGTDMLAAFFHVINIAALTINKNYF